MPPHCDSLDGPVVRAAQRALEADNPALVLPFVPKSGEQEVLEAFRKVVQVRQTNVTCREVADRYFFETVVRIHRAGEGAPFTGLKPAGLDVGPVIPLAEKAIENEDAVPLEDLLVTTVREEIARWNFVRAWPTKWDGPDLNAETADAAIETLELAHEGVQRA